MAGLRSWSGLLAGATLLVIAVGAASVPNFLTPFSLATAMATLGPAALMAFPVALLVITRDIDISVASTAALTAACSGLVFAAQGPTPVAVAVALAVGAVCGAVNGFFVAVLELPALLVTLGTLALFRGLCYVILGSTPISPIPDFYAALGNNTVGLTILPWALVPAIVAALVAGVVLRGLPTGRRVLATGGNPATARYSGVRTRRLRFGLFVASGLAAAVAGMIQAGLTSQVSPDLALGMELDVITMVFLGGVSVLGGKGSIPAVVWAAALLMFIRKFLQLNNVSGYAQGIVIGVVLIGSLVVTNAASALVERRRRSAVSAESTPATTS
ncbi:ABC transporter permease [Pseudonocardia oroxyli]|uniref:ABC transporter permease n=1 Tax=Pseudonocardia oroxyli TaxID=366584 RepID=UPI0015A20B1F|nr:ABC transporter permease [Pseudonocardia oroxyli]